MLSAFVLALGLSTPLVVLGQLDVAATCGREFGWMNNAGSQSPCYAAAQLNSLCNHNKWALPALTGRIVYDPPVLGPPTTVSACTCSWASYNLISACTACQGFPEQIKLWGAYRQQCRTQDITDTYFPSIIALPEGFTIPFWAGKNPTEWPNQQFSPTEAQKIQEQGRADLGNAAPPRKKSTNIGAIVGGVLGGLAVIGAAAALAFYIIRKQRRVGHNRQSDDATLIDARPPHMRTFSDSTVNSGVKSNNTHATMTSSGPMVTTQPTIATHQSNPSNGTQPFFSSVVNSISTFALGNTSASPPPDERSQAPRPEDVITPFTLPPTVDNADRKQANGEWPVFDQPNAPPVNAVRMHVTGSSSMSTPTRNRYNPPAYAESSPGSVSGGTPAGHRAHQGSVDTNHSGSNTTSSRTGPSGTHPTHTPMNSGSSMANFVPNRPLVQDTEANPDFSLPMYIDRSGPSGSGSGSAQTSSSPHPDMKRRPTDNSISGTDLA